MRHDMFKVRVIVEVKRGDLVSQAEVEIVEPFGIQRMKDAGTAVQAGAWEAFKRAITQVQE